MKIKSLTKSSNNYLRILSSITLLVVQMICFKLNAQVTSDTPTVAKILNIKKLAKSKLINDFHEEQIQFSYSTSDGGYQLKCTHWPSDKSSTDWQVICGKGTPTVKEFFVHLYIDEMKNSEQKKLIVFYSIHDNNESKTQFYSHFSIYRFANDAKFISFEQSLGIENDAAFLNLSFTNKQ